MRLTRARFERKWEDLWVGVFWKWTRLRFVDEFGDESVEVKAKLDVWVCAVPCFPLHLELWKRTERWDFVAASDNPDGLPCGPV